VEAWERGYTDTQTKYSNPRCACAPRVNEEDMEDATDPESYYSSASADSLAQEVKTFVGMTFHHSIPKRKRLDMAKEYPIPDMPASKVPKLDPDIKGALDRDFADRRDEQMAKIQASIMASCAPLANLWSHGMIRTHSSK